MSITLRRRTVLHSGMAFGVGAASYAAGMSSARADTVKLRLSSPASPTDQRALALIEVFGPAIKDFAAFEPHWNATLFKQGTENEAIARGNLEMSIASAQEFATIVPAWSIFTAGYLLRDAEHQVKVFNSDAFKEMAALIEKPLRLKLLAPFYLGKRHVNLRGDRKVMVPADLSGVKLRMPGTEAWLFLGSALGANPVPVAFTEVYTALQTGAIDGQENPLPTDKDAKFYEVTKQIVLTSHLVDWNFLTISQRAWDGFSPAQQATVQKAADAAAALGRRRQLKLEDDLVQFFKDQGLQVYAPDVGAFRKHVQQAYLNSKFAKDWPKGMVERINAIQ